MERIKEFTEIKREPPEFIEPRPAASWPSKGEIKCEDLIIRYAVCASVCCILTMTKDFFHSPTCLTFSTISTSRLSPVRRLAC